MPGFPTLIDECLSLKPAVIAVTTTPAAHLLQEGYQHHSNRDDGTRNTLGTGLVDNPLTSLRST